MPIRHLRHRDFSYCAVELADNDSANNIKECPVGQKFHKSIQISQIFICLDLEIWLICDDLKDFSPKATKKQIISLFLVFDDRHR